MKKKYVVESVNTFYEIHLVEAENEEEAKFIAANSDYNASKWLGQQVANISEFDERDMPRLKNVDSYFFDGYATIEDNKLLYRKMDGTLNGNMPQENIR
ncbi:MAG: hypothetical protein RJA41_42 [Actinomycetota bacterium]|jgi:hypothetical protein